MVAETMYSVYGTFQTKEEVVEKLAIANLRQYPPCSRTVAVKLYDRNNHFVRKVWERVPWPHLTFGEIRLKHRDYFLPMVFKHSRPWTDLSDAFEVLELMGMNVIVNFGICLGGDGVEQITKGTMTTEEVFWGTSFSAFVNSGLQSRINLKYLGPGMDLWRRARSDWTPFTLGTKGTFINI